VIHLHTFTPLVAAAACRSKAAVVYTEHGNFGFGRRLRVTDRVNRRLLKLFLNRCTDFVSFNSVFTQREAEHRYGLAAVSRDVVYNGIVTAVTVPPAYEDLRHALKHAFVVGTTSRFAGFKRIDRLIRAFAGLARSHADVRLLLVGDGPLRQELEALCAEHGILDKTVFTGYVAAARACQAVMDVCVFPSQGEPFGIAAVEALAAGKPAVVMNDGGGLLEIVQGVEPGDVVDDEAGLAARLEFYYARRERDPGMPGRRKEYAARFSIEAMEQRFFSEYSKLR
jgi:glycosyltransferase involved in cell wall biosynthesis